MSGFQCAKEETHAVAMEGVLLVSRRAVQNAQAGSKRLPHPLKNRLTSAVKLEHMQ